jgi:hypothetical protein
VGEIAAGRQFDRLRFDVCCGGHSHHSEQLERPGRWRSAHLLRDGYAMVCFFDRQPHPSSADAGDRDFRADGAERLLVLFWSTFEQLLTYTGFSVILFLRSPCCRCSL